MQSEQAPPQSPAPSATTLRERGPVARVTLADGGRAWMVTRFDEARQVLLDGDRFSREAPGGWSLPPQRWAGATGEVPAAAVRRNRLRALVGAALTPDRMAALHPRVAGVAEELLARMAPRGHADLTAEFARPLPVAVARELLGADPGDRERLRDWTERLTGEDPQSRAAAPAAFRSVLGYLDQLVERKRAEPGDDLTSALIQARADGERLSDGELRAVLGLLLTTGHETAVDLIGRAAIALLGRPDRPAAVGGTPDWDGPDGDPLWRFTTTEVTLGEVTIPRGEAVVVGLALAERGPDGGADADREERDHRAFGRDVHDCLLAPLARLQARVAVPLLLSRLPDLRIAAPGDPAHPRSTTVGPRDLPVAFTPAG